MKTNVMAFMVMLVTVTICCVDVMAAPSVRSMAAAKSTSSFQRGALRTTPLKKAAANSQSVRAASTPANTRLSVGRLHTSAGKSISSGNGGRPGSSNSPEYALAADMDAMELRIDELWTKLDTIEIGDLELATGEYTGD